MQEEETKPKLKKNVLDHIARIQIDLQPDEPCILSFHYEYKDYLKERDLVDVIKYKLTNSL